MTHQLRPDDCCVGDTVSKTMVQDWPEMTDRSAVAFKRWVGLSRLDGRLVRRGDRIFEVGDSDQALCRYNHSRQFN